MNIYCEWFYINLHRRGYNSITPISITLHTLNFRECIAAYIETSGNEKSPAQCPLCRGDVTKERLLEAAQCQEDEDEVKQAIVLDPFEDIIVDISSTKVNAVLRQLEISKQKGNIKIKCSIFQLINFSIKH